MKRCKTFFMVVALMLGLNTVQANGSFQPTNCEGSYPRHVQGICTNGKDAIYWSWTTSLVKTDTNGKIFKSVEVADHHGDLCYHDGRIYVATNLGKFNRPAGQADSWVFVYDADTLEELSKHPVPELVHGAGGMEYHLGKFYIVGGLPPEVNENYVYEYDENFRFIKRHVIASGYTLMGIQTVTFAEGTWWFGCYGKPNELLTTDENFQFIGKSVFNAAVGIASIGNGRFLIAHNAVTHEQNSENTKSNTARVIIARTDAEAGLVLETP